MDARAEDPLPADAGFFDVVHARRSVRTFTSAPVYVVALTDNESRWPTYNIHDGPWRPAI